MIGIKAHPAGNSINAETAALPYHDLATSMAALAAADRTPDPP